MGALSPVLRKAEGGYLFWCPGCDEAHFVAVERPLANGARWSFDGNAAAPTFSPSLNIRTGRAVDPSFILEEGDPPEICHSFIRDGHIQFCNDSTHELAGQTVPLPEWTA